ncbi:MAG TPA: hypothetical protein VEO95_03830 [Chthoniobacteraceae bacterium]|nr:hypothetical protein [Chthoniobacteraceae bacterium]
MSGSASLLLLLNLHLLFPSGVQVQVQEQDCCGRRFPSASFKAMSL